jgi:hypothetical protein
MAVQWTVSMDRAELSSRALEILKGYESVDFKKAGQDRIDMSEEEFFSFAEECASKGVELPTDGSDSWGKHI